MILLCAFESTSGHHWLTNCCADSTERDPIATTSCLMSLTPRVSGSTRRSLTNMPAIQPVLRMPHLQVAGADMSLRYLYLRIGKKASKRIATEEEAGGQDPGSGSLERRR